jgi:hypothetical protein
MALIKDLRLTESMSLQFRGEFFNAFNHAQFFGGYSNGGPNGNFLGSNFGDITSANGNNSTRVGQVAAKFIF